MQTTSILHAYSEAEMRALHVPQVYKALDYTPGVWLDIHENEVHCSCAASEAAARDIIESWVARHPEAEVEDKQRPASYKYGWNGSALHFHSDISLPMFWLHTKSLYGRTVFDLRHAMRAALNGRRPPLALPRRPY